MDSYLESFLRGFIPRDAKVEIDHYTAEKVAFLIVDIDLDEEPELLILFKQQGEEYLGVVKRRGSFWRLKEISLNEEDETMLGDLLEPIVNDKITVNHVGESYRLVDLFGEGEQNFVCLEGKRSYYCRTRQMFVEDELELEVIDFKQGDVFGNGVQDAIYLLGTRVFGEANPEIQNLTIRVVSGSAKEELEMKLLVDSGYGPKLIVEDFTGDQTKDIMVTSYTNPGGYIYTEIYSIVEDEIKQLFSTEKFNEKYTGSVVYKDGYKIEVTTDMPGKIYGLDLSLSPLEKLDQWYDENQTLKQMTEGFLMGTIAVNVVDYDRDNIYDLAVVQRIVGADNKENLGLVETFLRWSLPLGDFVPYAQYVSLYGAIKY